MSCGISLCRKYSKPFYIVISAYICLIITDFHQWLSLVTLVSILCGYYAETEI